MRTKHWKLLPGFLLGLLVMQAVGFGVAAAFDRYAVLLRLHWAVWLILSLAFPALGLLIMGRAEKKKQAIWYPVSYLTNAVGAGWAYGIVLAAMEPTAGDLLVSAAVPALMAVAMCLCYSLWGRTRWIAIGFTLLTVAAIFGCFVFGEGKGALVLGSVFGLLFFASMPISCGKVLCGEDWREQLAFSGFGAYLIVVLGAIVFLLEDGPDGIFEGLFEGIVDVGTGLDNQPKQTRQR